MSNDAHKSYISDPLQPFVDDPFILPKDVQKIVPNLTPRALDNMRSRHPEKLRFYKIMGRILYRRSDLVAYLENSVVDLKDAA